MESEKILQKNEYLFSPDDETFDGKRWMSNMVNSTCSEENELDLLNLKKEILPINPGDYPELDAWFQRAMAHKFEELAVAAKGHKRLMYPEKYFLTLTEASSPDPSRVLKALSKVLKSKHTKIVVAEGCIELTKKGLPHIHINIIKTDNENIDKTNVKLLNNGHRVDLQHTKDPVKASQYIKKLESKPDNEYLKKYSLDYYLFKYNQSLLSWHATL